MRSLLTRRNSATIPSFLRLLLGIAVCASAFVASGSPAYATSIACGPRYYHRFDGFESGTANSDDYSVEGTEANITSEYGYICDSDASNTNFSTVWVMIAGYPKSNFAIINAAQSDFCIDANNSDYGDNGDIIQLFHCNGNEEEVFTYNSSSQHHVSANGQCLDANSQEYPDEGDNIQLWACDGNPEQSWNLESNGNIQSAGQNVCLDAESENYPSDGDYMQLWPCNLNDEQVWFDAAGLGGDYCGTNNLSCDRYDLSSLSNHSFQIDTNNPH